MASPTNVNKTADEYRRLAQKCREAARMVSAATERADLLVRAQRWEFLADHRQKRAAAPAHAATMKG
jgi:hypothetical protein